MACGVFLKRQAGSSDGLGYPLADVTRITKLEGFKRHHILSMTRISCSVNVFAAS
jgi:hypothetical protein